MKKVPSILVTSHTATVKGSKLRTSFKANMSFTTTDNTTRWAADDVPEDVEKQEEDVQEDVEEQEEDVQEDVKEQSKAEEEAKLKALAATFGVDPGTIKMAQELKKKQEAAEAAAAAKAAAKAAAAKAVVECSQHIDGLRASVDVIVSNGGSEHIPELLAALDRLGQELRNALAREAKRPKRPFRQYHKKPPHDAAESSAPKGQRTTQAKRHIKQLEDQVAEPASSSSTPAKRKRVVFVVKDHKRLVNQLVREGFNAKDASDVIKTICFRRAQSTATGKYFPPTFDEHCHSNQEVFDSLVIRIHDLEASRFTRFIQQDEAPVKSTKPTSLGV